MQRTHSLATFWTNNDVAHHLVVNSNRLAGYIANSSKTHDYNLLYTTVSLFNLKHDNRLDDSPKSRTLPDCVPCFACQAQVIPHFPSSSMRHDHSCCSLADRAICPMAPLNASDIGSRTLVNFEGACHILSYVSAGSAHRNCPENVK
jgi:hypothetical protein